MRVGLLAARSDREADGIRDYTLQLLNALRTAGVDATLHQWGAEQPGDRPDDGLSGIAELDALVVQYNPFSYGRRGFAPRLPIWLHRQRMRRGRPVLAIMFHETYVDMTSFKWMLMGGWQRVQLLAVQAAMDVQFCSIQRWAERLRRTTRGDRPVHHLPVASTLPDERAHRESVRGAVGADPSTLVISCLGMRHPGRLADHVVRGALAAGGTGRRVIVLDLGPGERESSGLGAGVELRSTGYLDEPELARHIAASDLFFAPYADGVSTRRTTVMAALQHEVAVIGTSGHLTDDVLRDSPALSLAPVQDLECFEALAGALAADDSRRRDHARIGREVYERDFDWPVLVNRLLAGLDA